MTYNITIKVKTEVETEEEVNRVLTELSKYLRDHNLTPQAAPEVTSPIKVVPEYASIQFVRDVCEPWIELWGGDEWGEVMRDLHGASHTSYGFSDEDCALFAAKLLENLEFQKENWDLEGYPLWGYGYDEENGTKALEETYERTREVRDYWKEGGNLRDWEPSIKAANETLATLPSWLFGE